MNICNAIYLWRHCSEKHFVRSLNHSTICIMNLHKKLMEEKIENCYDNALRHTGMLAILKSFINFTILRNLRGANPAYCMSLIWKCILHSPRHSSSQKWRRHTFCNFERSVQWCPSFAAFFSGNVFGHFTY